MLKGATTNDLRPGQTMMFRGKLHDIVDYAHIKPGKGHAFVKVKLQNLESGNIFEHTFNAKEKVELAIIDKRKMEFIYRDGNNLYFMDPETFEQIPFDMQYFGEQMPYLKENTECVVTQFDGTVISIKLPDHMNFKVTQSERAVKGDTATNVTKNVTLETGTIVKVPLFIKEGDTVRIDTRTGEYIERVSS